MPTKKVALAVAPAPKKTATKTAAKKTTKVASVSTAKTTPKATKKSTGRPLVFADNNTSFWVSNGEILNSLVALRDALAKMDKAVFAEHVTADKNDFANWVAAVLDDMECARDLKAVKTPATAKAVVVRHLKLYSY